MAPNNQQQVHKTDLTAAKSVFNQQLPLILPQKNADVSIGVTSIPI